MNLYVVMENNTIEVMDVHENEIVNMIGKDPDTDTLVEYILEVRDDALGGSL